MYAHSVFPRRRIVVALTFAAVVLGLVAVTSLRSTASADPYPPAGCSLSASSAFAPGSTISVSGSGYPANSSVSLVLHSQATTIGSGKTDSTGGFTSSVTIPGTLPAGSHTIMATAAGVSCSTDPGVVLAQHIQKPGSNSDSKVSAAKSSSGGTAYTGFAAVTATVIAVGLLAGGVLMVFLGRRRRQS